MKKLFTLLLFSFFALSLSFGQINWQTVQNFESSLTPVDYFQNVRAHQKLTVSFETLKAVLSQAPQEFSNSPGLIINLPLPDGRMERFAAYSSPVMASKISAKYSFIQSYKIISLTNSKHVGRIGFGSLGFHAVFDSPNGKVYIDQYSRSSNDFYMSYYIKHYDRSNVKVLPCGNTSFATEGPILDEFKQDLAPKTRGAGENIQLRTYRLAIACTGEWGKKQGTLENALSQLNKAVNRLNEIFEKEIALRYILIDENDKILYFNGETDPYSNPTEGAKLISQNTKQINKKIGSDKYDLGHIFTVSCSDVGGIAALSSLCSGFKGNGVTCNYSSDIEYIASRVTAHEIGHQMSASHSFNNCNGNESGTGYEPGSGSTIMSYGGLCGSQLNVTDLADDYYHNINLEQIIYFTRIGKGNSCANIIETTNTTPEPTFKYEDGFFIPIKTPFYLEGSATDAENDALTYNWEQFDLGPQCIPGQPVNNAPIFISEVPKPEPYRYFPRLGTIITQIYDKREVLPTYDRNMTFRFNVRDNNPQGAGVAWKELAFFATEQAGPFLVTYPKVKETWNAGEKIEIQWDVANTNVEPVNCQYVDILLSNDGGYTYPYILKSHIPNNGADSIVVPNVITSKARFMVRANDNIFFDISNFNCTIEEANEPGFQAYMQEGYQSVCLPNTPTVDIATTQFLDFDTPLHFEVISGLPDDVVATFSKNDFIAGETTTLSLNTDNVTQSSTSTITIEITAGDKKQTIETTIELISSSFKTLKTLYPEKGASGIESVPTFTWEADPDASYYVFQISNNPDFKNGSITLEQQVQTNSFEIPIGLNKNEIYFWRVTGYNSCGLSYTTPTSTFASEALSCQKIPYNEVPVLISSSGKVTVQLKTEMVTSGIISDVNIDVLKGGHANFKELEGRLISPKGTEVLLFSNKCLGSTVFNCGFDQESPIKISCPLTGGKKYKPMGDLSVFNGEDILGTWTLEIKDKISGGGGQINEYVLDICSNASLSPPSLVNNNESKAVPFQDNFIINNNLLVEDENNDAGELIYTLTTLPKHGEVILLGETLKVGSTFRQHDLNEYYVWYKHTGTESTGTDSFDFVVSDGEGGWIDITTHNIDIKLQNSLSQTEKNIEIDFYPNPVQNEMYVNTKKLNTTDIQYEIISITGQTIRTKQALRNQTIRVQDLATGTYIIKFHTSEGSKINKFEILR